MKNEERTTYNNDDLIFYHTTTKPGLHKAASFKPLTVKLVPVLNRVKTINCNINAIYLAIAMI